MNRLLILHCVLAAGVLAACDSRERKSASAGADFAGNISRELATRVAEDLPGGGRVLLLMPPDGAGGGGDNLARLKGARDVLARDRFTLVEHRVRESEYGMDMVQGAHGVKDFTSVRLGEWLGAHGALVAVISFVGLPAEQPGTPDAPPHFYAMNFGPVAPPLLDQIRAGRIRGWLTLRGANPEAADIAFRPAVVLPADQYELLVPARR